jgi:hypothetical protein
MTLSARLIAQPSTCAAVYGRRVCTCWNATPLDTSAPLSPLGCRPEIANPLPVHTMRGASTRCRLERSLAARPIAAGSKQGQPCLPDRRSYGAGTGVNLASPDRYSAALMWPGLYYMTLSLSRTAARRQLTCCKPCVVLGWSHTHHTGPRQVLPTSDSRVQPPAACSTAQRSCSSAQRQHGACKAIAQRQPTRGSGTYPHGTLQGAHSGGAGSASFGVERYHTACCQTRAPACGGHQRRGGPLSAATMGSRACVKSRCSTIETRLCAESVPSRVI